MKKQSIEELEKKEKHHKRRAKFYSEKIKEAEADKKIIGFKQFK